MSSHIGSCSMDLLWFYSMIIAYSIYTLIALPLSLLSTLLCVGACLVVPQHLMTMTVRWMTETVTTAVRPAAACPLDTTARHSPIPPCTSIPWGLCRLTPGSRAQNPCKAMIWIAGNTATPGMRQEDMCALIDTVLPPLVAHWKCIRLT